MIQIEISRIAHDVLFYRINGSNHRKEKFTFKVTLYINVHFASCILNLVN